MHANKHIFPIQLYILYLIKCMFIAFATLYAVVNGYADGGLCMFNNVKCKMGGTYNHTTLCNYLFIHLAPHETIGIRHRYSYAIFYCFRFYLFYKWCLV